MRWKGRRQPMAKKRKTKAEKRMEWEEREQRVWDAFIPKLRAVTGLKDALVLLNEAVPESSPGRKYYSNLGTFLQTFFPPDGAGSTELAIYIDLIEKFDKG